ncbi:uncharacterized protein METZ01_LOCUS9489 [marine metagenome]|uniref:Uncharacterized protein n=1 Tax=marine metagenome TaxID=408172 RepID=A0A381NPX3_9ZZZZ
MRSGTNVKPRSTMRPRSLSISRLFSSSGRGRSGLCWAFGPAGWYGPIWQFRSTIWLSTIEA